MWKTSKKLPKLFHYGFAINFFKQKRPECPFKRKMFWHSSNGLGLDRIFFSLERPTLASRVSLFYSAIFQLTSAKFQTFAYNSRTVRSNYMKFWQQFEINELYVCTQFRGNRSRDFGFRTRKPPRKFGVKSGLSQKRFKYCKKYFIGLYVSRYPFIPTNPLLAAMRFISFFFPFFSY